MKKHVTTPEAGRWVELVLFRIYKDTFPGNGPTLKLFNNTRQQCAVRVMLQAVDSEHNPVDLTQADLDTIELIDYGSGEALPRRDAGQPHPDWAFSTHDEGYLWDESLIGATQNDAAASLESTRPPSADVQRPAPHQSVVTLYVSTSALSSRQIAARIPIPSSDTRTATPVYITTNSVWVDDPAGRGEDGLFNSSVTVTPAAFPTLPITSYGATSGDGRLAPVKVGSPDYFYWVNEHYIYVSYNGRELGLRSVSRSAVAQEGFSVYGNGSLNDQVQWSVAYYAQPGADKPENFPLPPLATIEVPSRATESGGNAAPPASYTPVEMFNRCVGRIEGASPTRVVVGLLMGNLAGRLLDKEKKPVAPVRSTPIHILDAYGNDHALTLSFVAKVNELTIAKV
ncbi:MULTISPECIES: hypothetical protein [Rhodanobacteraceae]|uniref:hypothetical protein n=1 Tax=Rhodanobacteraceae TaxID=1775411 RepID=UPI000881332A|nr:MULTISPECIES: hypothetical protein [Rhodanobacteraceae]SDF16276.1 hypothetical protein SAMN04515659_0287 [Dyella sp. 333MFSha]SKB82294.1 hypothetical protein SAMN05660880_02784 [Luteibacter sp. 22Crub2.1]